MKLSYHVWYHLTHIVDNGNQYINIKNNDGIIIGRTEKYFSPEISNLDLENYTFYFGD